MSSDLSRELTVLADGETVSGVGHMRLTGSDSVGLFPMPFTLRLWNAEDSVYNLLSDARELEVLHNGSVLASGRISNVYREPVPEGTETEVVFSGGLALWNVPVSLSVDAGTTVAETVRTILSSSGTGIQLLSFPGEDKVRTRSQAFFGRAAECIEDALSAVSARCCLTEAGLCVVPDTGLPVSMELSSKDLLDTPVMTGEQFLIVRTSVTGWPLGKMIKVRWKDSIWEGLVAERSIDADNTQGNWQAALLIEVKNV